MSHTSRLFAVVALVVAGAVAVSYSHSPAAAQDKEKEKALVVGAAKWEYKVIRPENNRREVAEDKMEANLNKLGEEGWECVGTIGEVTGSQAQGTWTKAVLILKRPKR